MSSNEATTPAAAFIDVAGRAVRYTAAGSGPAVLLLHGLDRSLGNWAPLQAVLPDHRLIAIDVPGFGRSQPLPDCRLASLAGHVERVLDRLGLTSAVHVVGNSLGGAIAMQLAAHAPARVSSLALLNSAGFGRECNELVAPVRIGGAHNDRPRFTAPDQDLVEVVGITLSTHDRRYSTS
ncbi:alpha/beta fold hydrolase [Streptomyces sp. NPDC002785]|uniref:alpha/beta fold hydrolase n=1 Tax=Streptomyces sp. NPDC002785 TaxID=3154543 RepID=UPI00332D39F8